MTKEYTKDYSLLRPFDLEAAKMGAELTWYDNSCVVPYTYIYGPDSSGRVCVKYSESLYLMHSSYVCMKPLCWIEGKPVYKGDVLYFKDDGSKHTVNDFTGTFFICDEGVSTWSIHIDHATWTKPTTKKTYWVNLYWDGDAVSAYKHETRESADKADICNVRIACVPVEIEE